MKLNLYIDKTKKFNPKDAIIFEDENSYFDVIQRVFESLKAAADLSVVTRSQSLNDLIKSLFSPYAKIEIIESKEITFQTLLSLKWNISGFDVVPSDKEIQHQKLLEYDLYNDQSETFSYTIISNFVSPYLAGSSIQAKSFGSLLNDLIKYKFESANLPQIIRKVLNFKYLELSNLKIYDEEFLDMLFNNPSALYENACLYLLIKDYPAPFKIKLQEPKWNNFLNTYNLKDLDISHFISTSTHFQHFKDELDIYLSGLKSELNADLIVKLVGSVSGLLIEEFDFFIAAFKSDGQLINKDLINKIETKFTKLGPENLDQLTSILDNIKPSFDLPLFNSKQEIEQILSDAVKFYYPCKIWADNTGSIDNKIIDWGFQFSEFILSQYEKISYHYDFFIHRFIHNNLQQIKESDLAIILIVDNLNYKYFRFLQEEFNKFNIILPVEPVPYLSLLPTTTSVGKFAIISGKRDKIDSSQTNYEPLIKNTWQSYFPDHSLHYFHADLAKIATHNFKGKEIIFINYLGIDEGLHSSPKKTLIDHKENVRLNLNKLSSLLNQFIKRNRLDDSAKIFFVSDHGSSQIPNAYPNPIKDLNFATLIPDAEIREDHRFIKVQKKDFEQLKSNVNIANAIYCIDDKVSGDGNNYVIAKGYGKFKNAASDAYVHGGATPEELIIPAGYFMYQKTKFKDLIVQLPKAEYRYMALETFSFRLANPNDKMIEKIQIEIFENETPKVKLYENEDIPSKGELEIETKFKLNKKDKSLIRVNITYVIEGTSTNIEKEFQVKIKSMVETSIDMDKLLNL